MNEEMVTLRKSLVSKEKHQAVCADDPGSCWVEQRAQNGRWELAPHRSSREHQVRMGSDWDFLEAGSLCL